MSTDGKPADEKPMTPEEALALHREFLAAVGRGDIPGDVIGGGAYSGETLASTKPVKPPGPWPVRKVKEDKP